MEINWTTFALEILNFLVLVWILKRFLYKPVLDIIAQRRGAVEKILREAEDAKREAEALQKSLAGRQAKSEQERQQARDELRQEIEKLRAQQLVALRSELDAEREKSRAIEQGRQSAITRDAEASALTLAARFATRLLEQVSSPELEMRLLEIITRNLSQLSEADIARLRSGWTNEPEGALVTSAYPIPASQSERLEQVLTTLVGARIPVRYEQIPDLLSGVRINIGTWALGANLGDELAGFVTLALDVSGETR